MIKSSPLKGGAEKALKKSIKKAEVDLILANRALIFQNEEKEKRLTELDKASHLYSFISQVKQNIFYVKDEEALFHNACQIAIEFGKFKIAWVGLLDSENKTIALVDQIGIPAEDIKKFKNIRLMASVPQEHILRTGNYYICNDISNNAGMESWKPLAAKQGICSIMVLAIKKSGSIIGTFNLYAAESNFFGEEEIKLLVELAGDISFALDIFEKEKTLKHTQELMVQNERRYRVLIEKSADMITLSTVGGRFMYGSNSIMKGLGYSEEELLQLSVFDIIHPGEISEAIANRDRILQTPGESFYYRQRRKHKNGNWIWCEGTLTNMLHEPGINALVSNFRDITEKKLAEEGLLLTQFAIDSAGDAVFWMTPDARIVKVNEAACVMLGYPRQEMIQLSVPDIDPYFNAEKWLAHYGDLRQKGSLFFETIQRAKDGRLIPVEIRANYIKFGDSEFNCAFSRDISERKKVEETLRQSEKRLKESQAVAQLGSWQLNFATGVAMWSEEHCLIYGLPITENIQTLQSWLSFVYPEDLSYVEDTLNESRKTLRNTILNHRIILKDNTVKHIYVESKFEFDQNGKPVGLYGIAHDVTKTKLAEIERLKIVNDLVLRNAELEQFGYIISHNLRAPVANIIGASSALNDPELSIEDKEMLSRGISTSVVKLDQVVKDLNRILEVKREISESKEKVLFSEMVDDIKISVLNIAVDEDIEIKYDFSAADAFTTLKPYLYSIFFNLISNSVKYRRQQVYTIIEVKSQVVQNKLLLTFTDNGMGIDLEKRGGEVFGLYKRFHSNIEGKGMGLFMVKTQVETLGGRINIKSEENIGTEFTIEFEI